MEIPMLDISTSAATGERFRDAAAVAFDRIVGDCLDREWVIGPQPQPNKARHGNSNAALDRPLAEDVAHAE
ncbi:hypothetical protein WS54_16905 [Burkholderia sp. NRF60-BP8]|nr:hypothetical protein WS54_16905 [Burkholderia sp. NRF60-BP8]KVA18053.1 hypothetical protein WS54_05580 [Burkholderia sp. NRF60-BP8]